MKTSATLLTLASLLAALATSAFAADGEFLLYTPKASAGEPLPASPREGVLVKRITVKRGDTLRDLSRKHLGVPSWFPQVLLFNSIKNPDLIHPGDSLLVPVSAKRSAAAEKPARTKKKRTVHRKHRHQQSVSKSTSPSGPESRPSTAGEQETFQQAKRAYVKGEYRKSLELFDSFLRNYPKSNLAADASLYRADCYLRLSNP